jgi:hypothetical protein
MYKIVQTLVIHQLHQAISDYTQQRHPEQRLKQAHTITVATRRYTIMENVE